MENASRVRAHKWDRACGWLSNSWTIMLNNYNWPKLKAKKFVAQFPRKWFRAQCENSEYFISCGFVRPHHANAPKAHWDLFSSSCRRQHCCRPNETDFRILIWLCIVGLNDDDDQDMDMVAICKMPFPYLPIR